RAILRLARSAARRLPFARRMHVCLLLPMLLSSPAMVRIDATIDRIEDDRLVLDVPPYPSLPIPRALGPDLVEGAAVTIEVERGGDLIVAIERDRLLLTLEGSRM